MSLNDWRALAVTEEDRRIEVRRHDDGRLYLLVARRAEGTDFWGGAILMKMADRVGLARLFPANVLWRNPEILLERMRLGLDGIRPGDCGSHRVGYTPAQVRLLGQGHAPSSFTRGMIRLYEAQVATYTQRLAQAQQEQQAVALDHGEAPGATVAPVTTLTKRQSVTKLHDHTVQTRRRMSRQVAEALFDHEALFDKNL